MTSLPLSNVTVLLHTSNRPGLAVRTLKHLEAMGDGLQIMLLDASDEERWAMLSELLVRTGLEPRIRTWRAARDDVFHRRIAEPLAAVTTEYVMFAADDDFYSPDWLRAATNFLDTYPGFASVHGHMMMFAAPKDPAEPIDVWVHSRRNPPIAWLEGDSAEERLEALIAVGGELATTAWYALQRTEHLRAVNRSMTQYDIGPLFLENWYNFSQAVLGRQKMLDEVAIAREWNSTNNHAIPGRSADFPDYRRKAADFLVSNAPISGDRAEELVEATFGGWERMIRIEEKRAGFPRLRNLVRRFVTAPGLPKSRTGDSYADPRLPLTPDGAVQPIVELARARIAAGFRDGLN